MQSQQLTYTSHGQPLCRHLLPLQSIEGGEVDADLPATSPVPSKAAAPLTTRRGGRLQIGTVAGTKSEKVAAFSRNLHAAFPNDEAALKRPFLAIRNAGLRWRRAIEIESNDWAIYGRVRRAPLCFSSEPANRIRHARLTETSLPRIRLRPAISCRKPTPVHLALRSSIDLCFLCYRLERAEQNPS
jgi:hypothetical protein